MLLSASVLVIVFGFICLFDSELAQSIHEADARMFGFQLNRASNWETRMMIQGAILIVMGGIGVMLGLGMLGF